MPTTPYLTTSQVGDLIASTLPELGELRFTEIATDLQDHTAMRNLLRKNRVIFESGRAVQWNVMVTYGGAAANVGLYASDNVNTPDVMTTASVDWRFTNTNYAVDARIIAMNRQPRMIVNMLQEQRFQALIGLAELMESNFWGPPVQSTDGLTPWGINTWVVKNATEGFNGGAPAGYTSIGLNPTTYPRWQNWTYQYTIVSKDDLVRHWRTAATKTRFKPVVDGTPTYDTGDVYGFYTNYNVIQPLEELLEAQNDNLGSDVASQDGKVVFRRAPVMWVPKLDADTTNPVYGLDWGVLKTAILRGWWLKETAVPIVPGQHTVAAQFIDLVYQWIIRDRRRMFVLATGTTYPS